MELDEQNIYDSQEFLLSVIGGAPFGIITIDYNGSITMINDLACEYLKIPLQAKSLIDTHLIQYLSELLPLKKGVQEFVDKTNQLFDLLEFPHHDLYLNFRGRPIVNGLTIIIEDLTRIKEMETTSLNHLLEGQEMERRRLSKEIHDGIGPLLSTVRMSIESIKAEIDIEQTTFGPRFKSISALINTIADDLRGISHDLMPRVLVDFGLDDAFQNMAERINETGRIEMTYLGTMNKERYDKTLELGIYRIGQELVNNALKHSGSPVLTVQLIKHPQSLVLMVEDKGVGFGENTETMKNKGIGLFNIETRVKALEGVLILDTVKKRGVTATVEVPIIDYASN